jgi:hypothetical protein
MTCMNESEENLRKNGSSGRLQNSAYASDLLVAGLAAALLSGIPSTLYALVTGTDVTEATRAAGAMLIPASSTIPALFAAAAVAHLTISFFLLLGGDTRCYSASKARRHMGSVRGRADRPS